MQLEMPLTDTPRSRRTDPVTSHLAAERIKTSGQLGRQQRVVLELIERHPGCTSAELAMHHALDRGESAGNWRIYRPMIARRCPELLPVYARKGDPRECSLNGTPAVVWYARMRLAAATSPSRS